MGNSNSFFDELTGTAVIVAPHMDDEVLACGGLIALLPNKDNLHVIYATDGMKSPAPIIPNLDSISADLGRVRTSESIAAMNLLGIKRDNLHFLGLPEAQLKKNIPALSSSLEKLVQEIHPKTIFMPFRYDRHPDHLAVNHKLVKGLEQKWHDAQLIEYFVYYRSKLLPKHDIRKYIHQPYLIQVDISSVAKIKRQALDCFKSQNTVFYPWQTRPILTPNLLEEECKNPEFFLKYDPSMPGPSVFSNSVLWIRLAHRLEPFLQKRKYLAGAYLKRVLHKNGNTSS